MSYKGKCVKKQFNCSTEQLYERVLKHLYELGCRVLSRDASKIIFISNVSGWEYFTMNGNYKYQVNILEEASSSTICSIRAISSIDSPIPLFDMLFGMSATYAQKILDNI